ncbi:hypothetical protein, partial [Escherichia coli]|uniref:hypothetical protein n=1 Tax=Escherichia coli TaxID=562 RepID=UPI0035933C59
AWKAAAPNIQKYLTVNRRSPASAGNALTGCCVSPALPDPVCFREKPALHKVTGGQGKTEYLSPFFSSVYFPR